MGVMYSPGFSFIIPALNEEANIRTCVTSIVDEMRRARWTNFQIFVVDNGSTDATASIARDAGALVVEELEKGVVWARTRGAKVASYSHLVNIDADNIMPQGWAEAALEYLLNRDVSCISGPLYYHDMGRFKNLLVKSFYWFGRFFHNHVHPFCQGGNYILRHDVYDKMGGYDLSIPFYGEDTMTAHKAKEFGTVIFDRRLQILSSGRRFRGQGMLLTAWLYAINYLAISFRGRPATQSYLDFR